MSKDKPVSMLQRKRNNKPRRRMLGPVENLEEHVEPDWWCRIFNSLYLKTDGDVVDDSEITATEVDAITDILKISPDDSILDLCCGQGRHSLELAKRGFRKVQGLDRSHYLVQKARASAKNQALDVRFREGDARKLPHPNDSFNVVLILGNSFGYFETLQDDLRVLRNVMRVLMPWGKLLIDTADGEHLKKNFQRRSWEWMNSRLLVCRERSLSLDRERMVSREVITHIQKGVVADRFYAERLYSRKTLAKLLAEAGLVNVSFPREISPNSKRAQDLGMMERRILTTAQCRKEWTRPKRGPEKTEKQVAVVLGDPGKPDPLKPKGVFDDDDLYTVDRMKQALQELDGYRFTYLNDHSILIQELMKLAGRVDYVFNLCDEGLCNDPDKELQVPAVLEAMKIPYTGSGPRCLACCYDKSVVRGVAKEMGIPVPAGMSVRSEDSAFELPFDFPVIVKPIFGDSSFGITAKSVAYETEQLIDAVLAIRQQFGYDKPILAEEFLTGKDLTVGIIGTPPSSYTVLPILEEDYSALPANLPRICGYEAKWRPDSPYWRIKSVPAVLPSATENRIIECCVNLAERLECLDYARFDWRLDAHGKPRLLEVNPNPGWCWDGHLAKMATYSQMTYSQTLGAILRAAEERLGINPAPVPQ